MTLRPVEDRDLPAIAAIHKAQFSSHFLGQYSRRVIAAYYRCFLGHSIFMVHETMMGPDGFVLGGKEDELSSRAMVFLRTHWMRCLWDTLLRPKLWITAPRRAIRYIYAARRNSTKNDKPLEKSFMEILSIAVAEGAKGKGVAATLIGAFEQKIKDSEDVYELSVAKTNARAIRFYEKMGFEVFRDTGISLILRKKLR
jgi:ribosomal protein S18 acetylase RimI-like enzyme